MTKILWALIFLRYKFLNPDFSYFSIINFIQLCRRCNKTESYGPQAIRTGLCDICETENDFLVSVQDQKLKQAHSPMSYQISPLAVIFVGEKVGPEQGDCWQSIKERLYACYRMQKTLVICF